MSADQNPSSGLSPVEKYKQIKDNISTLSEKITAFEKEKASLEGQRDNILSSAGVKSQEELEKLVASKKEEFEKEVTSFYEVFVKVKEKVEKIESLKREMDNQ